MYFQEQAGVWDSGVAWSSWLSVLWNVATGYLTIRVRSWNFFPTSFQVFDDEYLPMNHSSKDFMFLQRLLFCAFAMKRWDDTMPVRYTFVELVYEIIMKPIIYFLHRLPSTHLENIDLEIQKCEYAA